MCKIYVYINVVKETRKFPAVSMYKQDESESKGIMYDHNKLLTLYQTDVQSAIIYLDLHIGYFLNRVGWKIGQYELDEMRSFAISVIDTFARKQLIKREMFLRHPGIFDNMSRSEQRGAVDKRERDGEYKFPIVGNKDDSNKIGKYLIVTLRGRLMNVAKAEQDWNNSYDPTPPEDCDIAIEEKDEITMCNTYNLISDAILSLPLTEKQVIGIHMHFIGGSSISVCSQELGIEQQEFRKIMKEAKNLIQQYIYDYTKTDSSDRGL